MLLCRLCVVGRCAGQRAQRECYAIRRDNQHRQHQPANRYVYPHDHAVPDLPRKYAVAAAAHADADVLPDLYADVDAAAAHAPPAHHYTYRYRPADEHADHCADSDQRAADTYTPADSNQCAADGNSHTDGDCDSMIRF